MTQPSAGRRASNRPVPTLDEVRLMSKVARMYHERGIRQPQIAAQLSLSQPRVSRLLRQAAEIGIVRTIVTTPAGVYTDLEDALRERYDLRDAVVVDAGGTEGNVLPALGNAMADYLDVTLTGGHVIGVSSWSETLLAGTSVMRRKSTRVVDRIVQIVGGIGDPAVQMQATQLTGRLADVTGGDPVFLPAPGLVGSAAAHRALTKDPAVADVAALWPKLTDALLGIGTIEPSPLLRRSGNAITEEEQRELRDLGAVGDVCFRFFDADGRPVRSKLDQRLVGIAAADLLTVPRRVGVAGGDRKFLAIRGALHGRWVNVLITDVDVARRLLNEAD